MDEKENNMFYMKTALTRVSLCQPGPANLMLNLFALFRCWNCWPTILPPNMRCARSKHTQTRFTRMHMHVRYSMLRFPLRCLRLTVIIIFKLFAMLLPCWCCACSTRCSRHVLFCGVGIIGAWIAARIVFLSAHARGLVIRMPPEFCPAPHCVF